ncbi:MAG: hypothetical protein RLZZ292_3067 [Bacteroidota bacterium]
MGEIINQKRKNISVHSSNYQIISFLQNVFFDIFFHFKTRQQVKFFLEKKILFLLFLLLGLSITSLTTFLQIFVFLVRLGFEFLQCKNHFQKTKYPIVLYYHQGFFSKLFSLVYP